MLMKNMAWKNHTSIVCFVVTPFFLLLLVCCCSVSSALSSRAPPRRLLLVLGLGPVGQAVARQALLHSKQDKDIQRRDFEQVFGTVRSAPQEDNAGDLQKIVFSRDNIRQILPLCTHVLITIPPQLNDLCLEAVYSDMEVLLGRNAWVGFVSTTGVYGNHDGAWVTEESSLQCRENTQAAIYRDAEDAWRRRAAANGWTLFIFRCAGIYGPQRSALHTVYKKGYNPENATPLKEGGMTNRIHEVDIARAIVSAMMKHCDDSSRTLDHRVFNLSDDEPATRSKVMQHASHLLRSHGVSITSNTNKNDSTRTERSRRRGADQKRVSNRRMHTELLDDGGGLKYPTFREGLESILNDPTTPWSDIK